MTIRHHAAAAIKFQRPNRLPCNISGEMPHRDVCNLKSTVIAIKSDTYRTPCHSRDEEALNEPPPVNYAEKSIRHMEKFKNQSLE